jgi:hypothetical protein
MGVAAGMAAGLACTIAAFAWPIVPAAPVDGEARIALWLACAAFASLWLLIAIGRLAGHRFFRPAYIDGGGLTDGSAKARMLQSLIQNTLEQLALAVIAYGAWLWLAPEAWRGLVIVCALFFGVGRLLFFAGYGHGAPFRALGFTLTFYPTVGLYLFLLPTIFSHLFG